MPEKSHKCDWCYGKRPAVYRAEVMKKKRNGYVGTLTFWYSCKEHKDVLSRMCPGSPPKKIKDGS